MDTEVLQALADKQSIQDVLARYCRGLDRMDMAMAKSVFHADCPVNYHGIYQGTGHGFVDFVWDAHSYMERHSHQVNNLLIELEGNRAASEAYLSLVLWTLPDEQGQRTEMVIRGRYLDRWERGPDSWLIREREYVQDMQVDRPLEPAMVSDLSTRDDRDASWRFLSR